MMRKRQLTLARDATANKTRSRCTTHMKPTGGGNAQSSPRTSEYRSEALRHVWREVRPHPALFLAIAPLFEEMRRWLQRSSGERPQVAVAAHRSSLLRLVPRKPWAKLPPIRHFVKRSLRSELPLQTPAMELSLLPIGDTNQSAGRWT